jgi:CRP-like cAMP-binding protein
MALSTYETTNSEEITTLIPSAVQQNQPNVVPLRWDQPSEVLHLKENELIYREGDIPKGLYYVKSGAVKIVVNRKLTRGRVNSPEFVTKLVGPGEFFGYQALIGGANHSSFAKTVHASEIYVFPREVVNSAAGVSGGLGKQLLNQMVKDLEAHEVINQLHYLASVQERIAYQLVLLSDKFGVAAEHGTLIDLKLTRNELAQLAGTINESLSRHLTELKNENVIELSGKHIIVKDRVSLMARSGNFAAN